MIKANVLINSHSINQMLNKAYLIILNYRGLTYVSINLMEHRITSNAIVTHTRRSREARRSRKYAKRLLRRTTEPARIRALAPRRPPIRKKRRDTAGRRLERSGRTPGIQRRTALFKNSRYSRRGSGKEEIATSRHRTKRTEAKKRVGRRVSTTRTIFRQWCTADWLPDKSCSRTQVGEGWRRFVAGRGRGYGAHALA